MCPAIICFERTAAFEQSANCGRFYFHTNIVKYIWHKYSAQQYIWHNFFRKNIFDTNIVHNDIFDTNIMHNKYIEQWAFLASQLVLSNWESCKVLGPTQCPTLKVQIRSTFAPSLHILWSPYSVTKILLSGKEWFAEIRLVFWSAPWWCRPVQCIAA